MTSEPDSAVAGGCWPCAAAELAARCSSRAAIVSGRTWAASAAPLLLQGRAALRGNMGLHGT